MPLELLYIAPSPTTVLLMPPVLTASALVPALVLPLASLASWARATPLPMTVRIVANMSERNCCVCFVIAAISLSREHVAPPNMEHILIADAETACDLAQCLGTVKCAASHVSGHRGETAAAAPGS